MKHVACCLFLLPEDINRKAQALIEEFRARELEYDATTAHGATQGARF
ncbi:MULTISPECIES: hypothetical protein [unclassified Luteimonas]